MNSLTIDGVPAAGGEFKPTLKFILTRRWQQLENLISDILFKK